MPGSAEVHCHLPLPELYVTHLVVVSAITGMSVGSGAAVLWDPIANIAEMITGLEDTKYAIASPVGQCNSVTQISVTSTTGASTSSSESSTNLISPTILVI